MLEVRNLAAFRGDRLVLHDLSFAVGPGEALVLAGPNGAGKSTLLRVLAGLLRPEAGAVLWRGEDALADFAAHGRRIAFVGHQDAVKPGLSAAENLRFAAQIGGGSVRGALDEAGLADLADVPARMLSAGQRRRLALARLALTDAPLWLLDEPTLGLDAASVERFGALLGAHRARGGLVVAATHLPLPLPGAAMLDLGRHAVVAPDPVPQHKAAVHAAARTDGRWRGRGPARLAALLARELRLALRHSADSLAAIMVFFVAAALFPLAIGPEPELLGRIAPGIVWVSALLAALLPLERLFGSDAEDGSLDQLLVCGVAPSLVAASKAAAHWLMTGLPLTLAAVPGAVMLRFDPSGIGVLLASLVPGTLLLSLLGSAGASVVIGARRGGVLLPLLVLPLMVPVLVFGAGAAVAAASGLSPRPHLMLLLALLAAGLPLCPLAAGAALRTAAE